MVEAWRAKVEQQTRGTKVEMGTWQTREKQVEVRTMAELEGRRVEA